MAKTLSMGPSRLWYDAADPGLSETNVDVFNWWLNTVSGQFFICIDNTLGSQAWEQGIVQGDDISTGNILIGSGSYIQFTGESHLSHYLEQQTWVPVITGSGSAGTGTYTAQNGYYTRIGNMIFMQVHVSWSAHTGTGDMLVTNLPFSARASTNYDPEGIANPVGIPLPGSSTSARCQISSGTSIITLSVLRSNNTNDPIQMNATGEIHITVSYLT